MNEKIWTVEDAAKILEIPIKTVYKRAHYRGIKLGKTGGHNNRGLALLYSDEDIESMSIDKRRHEGRR